MPRTILDDRDLNELVTRDQLEERLKRIETGDVNLENYYTKDETQKAIEEALTAFIEQFPSADGRGF